MMNEGEMDMIKAAAEGAAEGLAKNIYPDLVQPGAKVVGQGLADILKLALSPVTLVSRGYDKILTMLGDGLFEKLKNVSNENLIAPDPIIIGSAMQKYIFLESEPDLREMFENLITTSMDKQKAQLIHPGLVETLKNISSAEARLLKEVYLDIFPFYFHERADKLINPQGSKFGHIHSYYVTPNIRELYGNFSNVLLNLIRLSLMSKNKSINQNATMLYWQLLQNLIKRHLFSFQTHLCMNMS